VIRKIWNGGLILIVIAFFGIILRPEWGLIWLGLLILGLFLDAIAQLLRHIREEKKWDQNQPDQ